MRHFQQESVLLLEHEQLVVLLDIKVIVEADLVKQAVYCRQLNVTCNL
ncbi:hypothetical protein V7U50_10075 [Segatella copri]